jgi:hypothetical protein
MPQSKLNTFFSTFNIVLCLVGYQFTTTILSGVISDTEGASRLVTVPYRGFALLICLITIILNLKSKFSLKPVIKVLFVFWLLLLLRFFYDMYFRTDVFVYQDKINEMILNMVPMTIIPMYSVMKSYRSIDLDKQLFWTYLLFAITICVTYFTNQSFQEETTKRLLANIAINSIDTGHLGLTVLILSAYLLFNKHLVLFKKAGVCIIGIIGFLVMMRAGSRGPVLAMIGVVAVWILGVSKKKVLNISLLLILSFFVYYFIDYIFQFMEYISPVLSVRLDPNQEQLYGRDNLFTTAFNYFLENPVLGKNFAIYLNGSMGYPHNAVLDSFMQLGIIGGGMMLYMLWKAVVKIIYLVNIRSPYFWLGLILMQNIMKVMVSGAFYLTPLISILIVLLFMPLDDKK